MLVEMFQITLLYKLCEAFVVAVTVYKILKLVFLTLLWSFYNGESDFWKIMEERSSEDDRNEFVTERIWFILWMHDREKRTEINMNGTCRHIIFHFSQKEWKSSSEEYFQTVFSTVFCWKLNLPLNNCLQ